MNPLISLLSIPAALLLDWFFAEPKKWHPLVGFGHFANSLEKKLNKGNWRFLKGMLAWVIAVMPITLLILFLGCWLDGWSGILLNTLFGWIAIGWQSLRQHGLAVYQALDEGDLTQARQKTALIVSRETSHLNETELGKATVESILENGSDAIFAPLFWLAVMGAPGVVLYRLSNTLDALWGYRSQHFEQFGKFSARMDDVLNYIPARITAVLYTISGNTKLAWHAWRKQAKTWYSPNAGVVMATGAGALNLELGGTAVYHGQKKERPVLGAGKSPQKEAIMQSIRLIDRCVNLIILVYVLIMGFLIIKKYTPLLFATFHRGVY